MKKTLSIILSTILSLCTISACSTKNSGTKPVSSTNSDPKPVFVVPTNYGKECLKNSTIKEIKRKPIWNNEKQYLADNAYEMTVYSKADYKAHIEGKGPYTEQDIDVQLFGLGTNTFNSPEAETVLYATTNENEANNETSESTNDENLITGVEYAYQTGPIRNSFGTKQEIWLKTTVMEASTSNGYYIESRKYQPTYTQIFLTIIDGIPPLELGSDPFEVSKKLIIDNNSSEDNLKSKLEEYLREKVLERYRYLDDSRPDFDCKGDNTPFNIRFENFDMNAESFTGLLDVRDTAGNEIKDQAFTINVVSTKEDGLSIPDRLFDIGGYDYKKATAEQIDSRVKNAIFNYFLNQGKNANYTIETIRESYKLYSDGFDQIHDIVKNKTCQEIRGNIYYKGVLINNNVAIAKFRLVDRDAPVINYVTVSDRKQLQEKLDKEFKNLNFDNYLDYVKAGIDLINQSTSIYDEIWEDNYYFYVWITISTKENQTRIRLHFYIRDYSDCDISTSFEVLIRNLNSKAIDSLEDNRDIKISLTKDKQIMYDSTKN